MLRRFSTAATLVAASSLLLPFAVFAQAAPVTSSTATVTSTAPATSSARQLWSGKVTAVNGNVVSFTGDDNKPYTVDVSTSGIKLVRRFGGALPVTEIQVGDRVQVIGMLGADGMTIAPKSFQDISLQAINATFVGNITAINGTSFTLASKKRGNQTINTTSTTKYVESGATSPSFSNLVVNQTVTVSGIYDRTASNVTANSITVKVSKLTLKGTITAVSGSTLTVTSSASGNAVYTVDASKAKLTYEHGRTTGISIATFAVNDSVTVVGSAVSGSMDVVAKTVRDDSKTYGSLKVTGTVTAISGTTLTITGSNSTVYTIDASSAKKVVYKGGRTASLSVVVVGDTVVVTGTGVSGSTSFAATGVRDTSQTLKKPAKTSSSGTSTSTSTSTSTTTAQ